MPHVLDNKDTSNVLIRFGKVFCLIGLAIPVLNLILRIISPKLIAKIVAEGLIVINPLSTILFFFLGVAIWLVRNEDTQSLNRSLSLSLAGVVMAVTIVKALAFIFNWSFSIDAFLFGDYEWLRYGEANDSLWSQRFPYILVIFALLSLAVLLIDTQATYLIKYSQVLSYIMILLAMVNVYGYVFQIEIMYGKRGEALPMSLLAAISSFFLSTAILFLRPYRGSMRLLIGSNPTKVILIRFFALLAPLLLGWFETIGEKRGYYSKEFGKAILTTFSFALTMGLLGVKAEIQYTYKIHKAKIMYHIKRERKRLRRILKYSPTYINIVDLQEDKLVYSNIENKKLLDGKEPSSGKGFMRTLEDMAHKDDSKQLKDAREKLNSLGMDDYDEIEYRIIDSDKKVHWFSSRRMIFKRKRGGGVLQILMNTIDITKLKKQVEKVSEQEKKIENINIDLRAAKKKTEKANEQLREKTSGRTSEVMFYEAYWQLGAEAIIRFEFQDLESIDLRKNAVAVAELMAHHAVIADVNPAARRLAPIIENALEKGIKWSRIWQAPELERLRVFATFAERGARLWNVNFKIGDSIDNYLEINGNITGIVKKEKLYGFWIVLNSG